VSTSSRKRSAPAPSPPASSPARSRWAGSPCSTPTPTRCIASSSGAAPLGALISSIVAGVLTLALVWRRRFEAARYTAAVAVAAIIAGWALAQYPRLLPGLTVAQAAAPHDTLVAIVVAVIAGGALLFPSLGLLLSGRLDRGAAPAESAPTARSLLAASAAGLLGRGAVAAMLIAVGFLTVADAPWAHIIGVLSLFAFIMLGFAALAPPGAGLLED